VNEISIQNAGVRAYLLPRVIDALGLDEVQVLEIQFVTQQLAEAEVQERKHFFGDVPQQRVIPLKDREAGVKATKQRKILAELHGKLESRADRTIQRVLTRAQMNAFVRLRGAPFDVNVYRGTDAELPNPKGPVLPIRLYPDSD
jgi:hypothetical protein